MNGARHRVALGFTCFFMICLTVVYPFLLYTENEFVTRWRTLYIETAMGTMTHQWLATWIIPKDIIDSVMLERYALTANQATLQSDWLEDESTFEKNGTPRGQFFAMFSELDQASFNAFIKDNPDTIRGGYANIEIDRIDTRGTGLKTTSGDEVLAINAKHGIMIIEVTGTDEPTGEDYVGKVALCKKPENIFVGTCDNLFSYGSFVSEMTEEYSAILGINASGFEDDGGTGNGGTPYGFLKSEGKTIQQSVGGDWKVIGFDEKNRLQIGAFEDTSGLRDAVEFWPALVLNGKTLVQGSGGLGTQPRSAIGQAKDKTVIMLVVDGRQSYSIGCTIGECAKIMERYGAYQAAMLDGGSSSVMVYDGREITKPTTATGNPEGRYLPNAFLVK